jgi:hypothetical protein
MIADITRISQFLLIKFRRIPTEWCEIQNWKFSATHFLCCSLLDRGSLRNLRSVPTEKKPWLFIPQTACLIVRQAQESNRRGPNLFHSGAAN